MFSNINVSASGLTAQRLRMNVIADNIANVNTTRTEDGKPYRRKTLIFQEKDSQSFARVLNSVSGASENGAEGVEVEGIVEDKSPFKMVYKPNHPDANKEGYVAMPNVNIATEMVDMINASRSYEANVTALNTSKNMAMKALQIGRG